MRDMDIYRAYNHLSLAIIEQAVTDYRMARAILNELPSDVTEKTSIAIKNETTMHEVERFIRSEYFTFLCEIDSEMLLEHLKSEKVMSEREISKAHRRNPSKMLEN